MTNEDLTLFRQAEALANSHQTLAAYRLFCMVESHGNPEVEVKFWILQTTPSQIEARSLLAWLEREAPNHPLLPQSRAFVERRWRNAIITLPPAPTGPVLRCAYCGTFGPTQLGSRVSTAGWVLFVVFLLLTIVLNWTSFTFWWISLFCVAGLFFQQKYCKCSRCAAELQRL